MKLRPKSRTIPAAFVLLLAAVLTGLTSYGPARLMPGGTSPAPARGQSAATASAAQRGASLTPVDSVGQQERRRAEAAFGQLPLSFERNAGQFEPGVQFAARGDGYSISLKPTEVALDLRDHSRAEETASPAAAESAASRPASARVSIRLPGANPAPRVAGAERLAGVSNYFVGRDPAAWRTNVPTFARVEYAGVYPGVDLVYYGNQRRLEYDFHLAPGADARRIALEFDGAEDLRLDANGDLVLRTGGGAELRQLKPVSYQLIDGERREVASRYALAADGRATFELGDYDPSRPLVIDPVLSYSTYLGGTVLDEAFAVARGTDGSLYVAGRTTSADFPATAGAFQTARGGATDAFVLKLNAAGTSLLYATYVGGAQIDEGTGVAVDGGGNAYVVGQTSSANFPVTAGALQTAKSGMNDAFALKLDPSGAALAYSTYLGGPSFDSALGVAVDAAGRAHVAGQSHSARFINGTPMQKGGSPVYKTTDAGANWQPAKNGIDDSTATAFAIHPTDSNTIYAGTNIGVFKTTDGGATWQPTGSGPAGDLTFVTALLIDPFNPATLYVVSFGGSGLYKSTDGGATYDAVINGLDGPVFSVAADPSAAGTLYAGTLFGVYKTTNGGASWTPINSGLGDRFDAPQVNRFAINPAAPAVVYAATDRGVFKTTNGGASWTPSSNGMIDPFGFEPPVNAVVIDPSAPSVLYAGTEFAGVFKSTNAGANWTPVNTGLQTQTESATFPHSILSLVINPANPSVLHAAAREFGLFKTTDAGATWSPSGQGIRNLLPNVNALEIDRSNPATLYAGFASGADAFAVRLNASGTAADYSVFRGGDEHDVARGVAADSAGDAYFVGTTASNNFPVAAALQGSFGGGADAFIAKLGPSGATLYSTYLGGDTLDEGRAVAVDSSGRAHVTGFTYSEDFPRAGPRQTVLNVFAGADLFVARLNAAGAALDYSVLHGGRFEDEGHAIALDPAGNAYVTGLTGSDNFPAVNPAQPALGGGHDAFVLKLGPASEVIYSTYLGGFSTDRGLGIAADASGAAYVVGRTSGSFPVVSPLDGTFGGGAGDAFVAKLSASADLAVSIADAPDPVPFGSNLTYTVTVTNVGELPATGARLTHTLPAGATLVSAGAGQGTCSGAGPVVCELGTLAGGASVNVTVVVTPPAVRTLSSTATVAANEAEVITANNTDTETTLVDFADLAAAASALRDPVPAGGRLTYLFGVSNLSGADAPNVVLNVTLPAGVTVVSCASQGGACSGTGNSRAITFASLAVGAARSALVTVEVGAGAAEGTTLAAAASVTSSLPDPAPANNTASANAAVAANAVRSSGNGKLVFNVFDEGLYVINEDGTGETRILAGSRFTVPTWSPDGTRIAFVNEIFTSSSVTFELRVVNADGSDQRLLSTNATLDSRPTWSPNGSAVAFVRRDRTAINVVNAAGAPVETTLVAGLPLLDEVSWSPDGAKLLYGTSGGDLWTVNVDGTGQTPLSNDPNFADFDPVWSPDGSKIMFLRRGGGQSGESIREMNADGSNVRPLPNFQGSARRPVYSPDAQKIAFGGGGIATMLADGTNLRQIPSEADFTSTVSWQPLPGATPPPPPPPTFRIAGRVSFPASHAQLATFTIRLSGTRTATTGTDAEGNYSFTVPAGSYTVTPDQTLFLSVSPESRVVTITNADQTGVDFTATPIIYSVSGHVRQPDGTPIPGIEITLNGSIGGFRTTVTAADGSYSFSNLVPNASYSIFVSLSSRVNFDFVPDAVAFGMVERTRVVDFVGTPARKFQFGSPQYAVNEGGGRVTVTVTRTGDASAAASVSYRTVDGSQELIPCAQNGGGAAFARCDYATSVDTLDFAPGETAKSFDIPVIDDAHVEGAESFTAVLLSPSANWGLGQTSTASVTIQDNDASPAQQNPIEGTSFFVRQHYLDFLNREPEVGEPWSNVLNTCPTQNNTPGCDRLTVSAAFFLSPEFALKGFYAYLYYRVAYDRRPFYEEITPDMRTLAGATPAEVFAKRAAYAAAFTQRGDFVMRYGLVTNQQYVSTLLGRYGVQQITTEDPQNFEGTAQVTLTGQQLVAALDNNTLTRAQVLRAVVQSNEVDAAEFHGAFVSMQYYGYLRRTPEQSGYEAWLKVIKQDPQNVRQMVNGFMNSQEYRLRFGQP